MPLLLRLFVIFIKPCHHRPQIYKTTSDQNGKMYYEILRYSITCSSQRMQGVAHLGVQVIILHPSLRSGRACLGRAGHGRGSMAEASSATTEGRVYSPRHYNRKLWLKIGWSLKVFHGTATIKP